jgi:subtilisin
MPNYIIRLRNKESFTTCSHALKGKKYQYRQLKALHAVCLSASLDEINTNRLIDPALIEGVYEDITVHLIQDQEVQTSSRLPKIPWGVETIGATYARIPRRFSRPKVAILDTGLSYHPALNISSTHVNFTSESSALDRNGHGTHIAGTIGGYSPYKRKGGNAFHGVYPQIPLVAVKAFTKDGSANLSSILEGIEWCINHNVHIINMSFGLDQHQTLLHEAIKLAYQNGIIMVAASGNDGKPGLNFPARYPEVISVGSINQQGQISDFSQYGNSLDIVAPGEEIFSTWIGKTYKTISGTSMACAYVSGALTLMLALKPTLSPSAARDILLQNTKPLSASYLKQGSGLVSVKEIISSLK